VGPLTNVKGIGPKTVQQIVEARRGLRELSPSVRKKLEDAKTDIDSLSPIADAVASFNPTDPEGLNIQSVPTPIAEINPNGRAIDVTILAKVMRVAPLNENEPSRVAKRGGKVYTGPINSVNLFVRDDTGEMFCKVNRYDFERLGREMVERARPGKSLYAIKGSVPPDFRMLWVKGVRYIGETE
jgi:hypothetical protein